MENFFRKETFYTDMDDLLDDLDITEDDVIKFADDWSLDVEGSTLEKMFQFTQKFVVDLIVENTDRWEDRFPEDPDRVNEKIEKAIKAGVDIDKINELLPSLYYPNGKKYKITKADLIEYLK